jgi:hypothetical protein
MGLRSFARFRGLALAFALCSALFLEAYCIENERLGIEEADGGRKHAKSVSKMGQQSGKISDDPGDDAVMDLRAFNPLFSPRYDCALVFHAFGLFLMGGVNVEIATLRSGHTVASSPVTFYNDVYLSNDEGQSWTYVGIANWWPRAAFGAASFGEYIYVYGGIGISLFSEISCFNDVWASQDGVHWSIVNIGIARYVCQNMPRFVWEAYHDMGVV